MYKLIDFIAEAAFWILFFFVAMAALPVILIAAFLGALVSGLFGE